MIISKNIKRISVVLLFLSGICYLFGLQFVGLISGLMGVGSFLLSKVFQKMELQKNGKSNIKD